MGSTAARMAAILADRDFADTVETHANTECDILLRLDLLRENRSRAAQTVNESARQLERLVKPGDGDTQDVRRLLLVTQTDRLCRRRASSERALMVGGRGVRLHPRSQVRTSEFFVALQGVDLPGQADTSIGMASGFTKDFVLQTLRERVNVVEDIFFDEDKGKFYARRVRMFEDLALDEPTLSPVDPAKLGDQMAQALAGRWDWIVEKHEGLKSWMQRWRFLIQHRPEIGDELSPARIQQVIEMAAFGRTQINEVLAQDLVGFLESALPKETARSLTDQVPAQFLAPSGVAHPIHYEEMHSAFVEVRLQEVFGLLTTPKIVFGKVPLTFRLLSPNFRPVQVTADLENFWRSGYFEVRKELRLRYPKHAWPEDPLQAKPEAKGRKRST